MEINKCEHKYIHLETIKQVVFVTARELRWIKTDSFFCEKCLDTKEIVKEVVQKDKPNWY